MLTPLIVSCTFLLEVGILIFYLMLQAKIGMKEKLRSTCDYYCDRMYMPSYTSFLNLPLGTSTFFNAK